jgi:hypothetical protein
MWVKGEIMMEDVTRRSFLKLLGKVAIVGAVTAVAPSTVMGGVAKDLNVKYVPESQDIMLGPSYMTAKDVELRKKYAIAGGEAYGKRVNTNTHITKAFVEEYENNLMELLINGSTNFKLNTGNSLTARWNT